MKSEEDFQLDSRLITTCTVNEERKIAIILIIHFKRNIKSRNATEIFVSFPLYAYYIHLR